MTAAVLDIAAIDRTGCDAPRHGDRNAYNSSGCRCSDARAAARAYNRAHYGHHGRPSRRQPGSTRRPRARNLAPGMVDGTGTGEQLRVLNGLGYDWATVAAGLGYEGWQGMDAVVSLAMMASRGVSEDDAVKVRNLFRHLIRMPAPCGPGADCALQNAVRQGWGVVDLVAVRRVLAGEPLPLTDMERCAAVWVGWAYGATHTAIARAAGLNGGTVKTVLTGVEQV